MAVLSHELRTPLNVMLGWTKALETNTLPDRRAHAASVVARNGRLLARLVEDLLDISRASVGQFEVSPRPSLSIPSCKGHSTRCHRARRLRAWVSLVSSIPPLARWRRTRNAFSKSSRIWPRMPSSSQTREAA